MDGWMDGLVVDRRMDNDFEKGVFSLSCASGDISLIVIDSKCDNMVFLIAATQFTSFNFGRQQGIFNPLAMRDKYLFRASANANHCIAV